MYKGVESLPQTQIFYIPLSLQQNVEDLRYFKLRLSDLKEFRVWTIKGCIAIVVRNSEFVAKTQ